MSDKIKIHEDFIKATDKRAFLQKLRSKNKKLGEELLVNYCLKTDTPLPKELAHLENLEDYRHDNLVILDKIFRSKLDKEAIKTLNKNYLGNQTFNYSKPAHLRKSKKSQNENSSNPNTTSSRNSKNKKTPSNKNKANLDEENEEEKMSTFPKEQLKKLSFSHLEKKLYEKKSQVSPSIISCFNQKYLRKLDIMKINSCYMQVAVLEKLEEYCHIKNMGKVIKDMKSNYKKHKDNYYLNMTLLDKMSYFEIDNVTYEMGSDTSQEAMNRRFEIEFYEEYIKLRQCENATLDQTYHVLKQFKDKVDQRKGTTKNRNFFIQAINHVVGSSDLDLNGVSSILTKCLLINCYERNEKSLTKIYFLEFLRNPVKLSLGSSYKRKMQATYPNRMWYTFFEEYVDKYSDFEIFECVFERMLTSKKDLTFWKGYFEAEYLNKYYLRFEVLRLGSDIEALKKADSSMANKISKSTELKILRSTETDFNRNSAKINIQVKNMPELEVCIFEIDLPAYLQKYSKMPDYSIELDGLKPQHILNRYYSQNNLIRVYDTIHLEVVDSKKTGFFVVDFKGSGMASRAIIQKGSLMLVSREYEYGKVFNILDFERQICKGDDGTGIWHKDTFLKVDEAGDIRIPFGDSSIDEQVVVLHGGQAGLGNIEVPKESYELKAGVIFNEEGVKQGRKMSILVKLRLLQNGKLISLKKIQSNIVKVALQGKTGTPHIKVFENQGLSDEEDLIVEFVMPADVNSIQLSFSCEVQKLVSGQQTLSYQKTVDIDDYLSRTLRTEIINLKKSNKGIHQVEVLGKDGEPMPYKNVQVTMHSKVSSHCTETSNLVTNSEGLITLGNLKNVEHLTVSLEGVPSQDFVLSNTKIVDATPFYCINEGEDIALPSFGLPLQKESVTLISYDDRDRVLKDCFECIQETENGQFLIKNLKDGTYKLRLYFEEYQEFRIVVVKGQRWNSSNTIIQTENSLLKVDGELKNLLIAESQEDDNSFKVRVVSNDPQHVRASISAFNYCPQLPSTLAQDLTVDFKGFDTFLFPKSKNNFISEKVFDDEIRYVLNRKNEVKRIGNTLKKPCMVFNRQFVRETNQDEEQLNEGGEFDISTMVMNKKNKLQSRMKGLQKMESMTNKQALVRAQDIDSRSRRSKLSSKALIPCPEYIPESGLLLDNLKPDSEGWITIPKKQLGQYSQIAVFVSDSYASVMSSYTLGETTYSPFDLRLSRTADPEIIFVDQRLCVASQPPKSLEVPENGVQEVEIANMGSTQILILEDLEQLFETMMKAGTGDSRIKQKLKFLASWEFLTLNQKLEKLDEYWGYELHVFCFFKDRKFFDNVLKNLISSKCTLQRIDKLLLGNIQEIEKLSKFSKIQKLNPLELVLLIYHIRSSQPKLAQKIAKFIKNKTDPIYKETQIDHLYDVIIESKTESDGQLDKKFMISEEKKFSENYSKFTNGRFNNQEGLSLLTVTEKEVRNSSSNALLLGIVSNEEEQEQEDDYFGGLIDIQDKTTKLEVQAYQKAGATFRYGEKHAHFESEMLGSGSWNPLWRSIALAMVDGGDQVEDNQVGFILDDSFLHCLDSCPLMMFVLAFSKLPSKAGRISTESIDLTTTKFVSTTEFMVLCKNFEETPAVKITADLLVKQNYFDKEDKFQDKQIKGQTVRGGKSIKEVTEFLQGKTYYSRVCIVNTGSKNLKSTLIHQIPSGSIPVCTTKPLDILEVSLGPFRTQVKEFAFYFPLAGQFERYPASVTLDKKLAARTQNSKIFKVVATYERGNKPIESFQDVFNYGTEEEMIQFIEKSNLHDKMSHNMSKVYWMLKNKEKYKKILEIFRKQGKFDHQIWKFSILHNDEPTLKEYLTYNNSLTDRLTKYNSQFPNRKIVYHQRDILQIDEFKVLDYDPLINPRAHNMKQSMKREGIKQNKNKDQILNVQFRETYTDFLYYCCQKVHLEDREYITMAGYLTMQDRIEDAQEILGMVKRGEEPMLDDSLRVQYDYLRMYLSVYTEFPHFTLARKIIARNEDIADTFWGERFNDMKVQIQEYETDTIVKPEEDESLEIHKASNKEMAEYVKFLKVEESKGKEYTLEVTHMNVERVKVGFHEIDIEILFSKMPFSFKDSNINSFIKPRHEKLLEMEKASSYQVQELTIPEDLRQRVLLVKVEGGGKNSSVLLFDHSFEVSVTEAYGLIRVSDKQGQYIPKAYVKCFMKGKGGARGGDVKFYKDGYTDFGGMFDYASLNSDSMDNIEKFAVYVYVEGKGHQVIEVGTPRKMGLMSKA